MHPLLINFNRYFGFVKILNDINVFYSLLEYYGLIPKKDECPKCPLCNSDTKSIVKKGTKLGFLFLCSEKYSPSKCNGRVNPAVNTFFEGTRIAVEEIFVIIIDFILKEKVTNTIAHLNAWRADRGMRTVSCETVCDYYGYCREVAEIIACHNYHQLGGAGMFS